jgi:hypothetical protein
MSRTVSDGHIEPFIYNMSIFCDMSHNRYLLCGNRTLHRTLLYHTLVVHVSGLPSPVWVEPSGAVTMVAPPRATPEGPPRGITASRTVNPGGSSWQRRKII